MNISIKYTIEEIFECRETNNVLPKELEIYCNNYNNKYSNNMSVLNDLINQMSEITKSHSIGINPNDISLVNIIRENLNKLDNKNYNDILSEIKGLNYSHEGHFISLASEIIMKSMNDVMAYKGFDTSKDGLKTPSELYIGIAIDLSQFFIESDDKKIKFKNVFSNQCKNYFTDLTNKTKRMDKHNTHRVNNYKGFMNMIGLVYINGLFPKEIIEKCFEKVINLILSCGLPQEDTDNYYTGYEKLLNKILLHFEKNSDMKNPSFSIIEEFKNIIELINRSNNRILTNIDSELNDTNNETKNNENKNININTTTTNSMPPNNNITETVKKPLRTYSIMTFRQNIVRIAKLVEKYNEIAY